MVIMRGARKAANNLPLRALSGQWFGRGLLDCLLPFPKVFVKAHVNRHPQNSKLAEYFAALVSLAQSSSNRLIVRVGTGQEFGGFDR